MNRRLLLYSCALLSFVFIPKPAFCRPEIKIIPIETQINFDTSHDGTSCFGNAVGCTLCQSCFPDISINCKTQKVTLDFSHYSFLIQIVRKYQKGTPEFDNIVKHELTHVALYKGVAEKFYQPMATAVLIRFEQSLSQQKGCFQIKNDVYSVFQKYLYRMADEYKAQNQLIDGDENYEYQWKQVYKNRQNKKKKKNIKIASRARVNLNLLKTKRQYNILPAENITVDRFEHPDHDGQGILKNLKTGVIVELDRADAYVDCQTGRIDVNLGLSTTITFNENKGTYLYQYLLDSLNRRLFLLEQNVEHFPEIIRLDLEKTYRRLAKNKLSCQEINTSLNQKLAFYQKKLFEDVSKQNEKLGNAVPLWRSYFEKDAQVYAEQSKRHDEKEEMIIAQNVKIYPKKQSDISIPIKKVENVKMQNEIEGLKTVKKEEKEEMSSSDKFYLNVITRSLAKLMSIFDLEKKFDNLLEKIKNYYSEIVAQDDTFVTKEPQKIE